MTTTKAEKAIDTACPQCGSQEPWGENSWCPACGFYPKFASHMPEPDTDNLPDNSEASELQPQADGTASPETPEPGLTDKLASMPQWAAILAGGVVAIFVLNAGVRVWVHFNGGRRAFFSLFEMLAGLCMIAGSSFSAWRQCKKIDKELSIGAIVTNPIDIWQPTLTQMPETRKRVWCCAWGFTLIVAANLIVGGFKYSGIYTNDWGFEQPTESESLLAKGIAAMKKVKGKSDEDELLEALEAFQEQKAAGLPVEPPTVSVVVYGVLADETREMGRILVARRIGGRLQHCAVVSGSDLDDKAYEQLVRQVTENLSTEATVDTMLNATWVKPIVRMNLTYEDVVGGRELVGAKFHSIDEIDLKKEQRRKDQRLREQRERREKELRESATGETAPDEIASDEAGKNQQTDDANSSPNDKQ